MATIPTYDNFQVEPNVPQGRLDAATGRPLRFDTSAAQGLGAASNAAFRVADDLTRQALVLQGKIDEGRAVEAANAFDRVVQDMTYGEQLGYLNITGDNALTRLSGKSLTEEYVENITQQRDDFLKNLGNEAQRRMFVAASDNMITKFRGGLMRHQAGQAIKKLGVVAQDTYDTATRDMALGALSGDFEAVDSALSRAKNSFYMRADSGELFRDQLPAAIRKGVSGSVSSMVLHVLSRSGAGAAQAVMGKYFDDLEADDIAKLAEKIQMVGNTETSSQVIEGTKLRALSAANEGELDRAFREGILNIESNSQQFGPDGKVLKSPSGALGIAQLMPDTAKRVAQEMGIPFDPVRLQTDPAYNAAIGQFYFKQLYKEFGGDMLKAAAAYNAGEGWVRLAEKAAAQAQPGTQQANWQWQLSQGSLKNSDGKERSLKNRWQTDNYLVKFQARLAAGGTRTRMTKQRFTDLALSDPRAANPAVAALIKKEAPAQFEAQENARKAEQESTMNAFRDTLYENGGNLQPVELDPNWEKLSPQQKVELRKEAVTFSNLGAKQSDPVALDRLTRISGTDEFINIPLQPYAAKLSPGDYKKFQGLQEKARREGNADNETFQKMIGSALKEVGIESDSSDAMRFRQVATTALARAQVLNGGTLPRQEAQRVLDSLMIEGNEEDGGWFFFDRKVPRWQADPKNKWSLPYPTQAQQLEAQSRLQRRTGGEEVPIDVRMREFERYYNPQ
jgi:hypothetical protein